MNETQKEIALAAHPTATGHPDLGDESERKFVEANKLSFLVDHAVGLPWSIATERQKNAKLRDELSAIDQSFEAEGVPYTLIKYPELERSHGDLDLLPADGLSAAESALQDLGYELDEDADWFRRKYEKSGDGLQWEADIHTEAGWVGVKYLDKRAIFERSTTRTVGTSQVNVPADIDELLIWAAHDVRSNSIPLYTVLHTYSLVDDERCRQAAREVAAENGWRAQFDAFVNAVDHIYTGIYESASVPAFELPYELPFATATMLKTMKALNDANSCGIQTGMRDVVAYTRFDLADKIGVR